MEGGPLFVVEPRAATRELAVSGLRRSGFRAVGVRTAYDLLCRLEEAPPALVLAESALPDVDGAELVRRLRAHARGADVPFFFVTGDPGLGPEAAARLGAQDVLRKPTFIEDLVTLAQLHTGRSARATLLEARLEVSGLARILRVLASGGRSGRVCLPEGPGEVRFSRGRIVDATWRDRAGEAALLRLLTVTSGPVRVELEAVPAVGELDLGLEELLSRGLVHVRRWDRVLASLYPLDARLVVDWRALRSHLADLPDAVNPLLRLFDGRRTLADVVDASSLGDLTTLEAVAKLDHLGLLVPDPAAGPPAPRATDRLLEGLFGALPTGLDAAPSPPVADWAEGWEKGAQGWGEVLPGAVVGGVADDGAGSLSEALGTLAAPGTDEAPLAEGTRFDAQEEAFFARGLPARPRRHATRAGGTARAAAARRSTPSRAAALLGLAVVAALATFGALWLWASSRAPIPTRTIDDPGITSPVIEPVVPPPTRDWDEVRGEETPPRGRLADRGGPPRAPASNPRPSSPASPAGVAPPAELIAEARAAQDAGRYAAAARLWGRVVDRVPSDARAQRGLGLALLDGGEAARAAKILGRARRLAPEDPEIVLLLGTALQATGDTEGARAAYEAYLRLAPEGANAGEVRAILSRW